LQETQSLLILGKDLDYFSQKQFSELFTETENIARLLYGLIKSLEKQK